MKEHKELKRKAIHFLFGIILCVLVYYDVLTFWRTWGLTVIGAIISLVHRSHANPWIDNILDHVERDLHRATFPGQGLLLIMMSTTILLAVFEPSTVVVGLLIWTFGDGIAAIIGSQGTVKHVWNDRKTIIGTVAGIVAASIAVMAYVDVAQWLFAVIVVTHTMIIESISPLDRILDDNVVVPILGSVLWHIVLLS